MRFLIIILCISGFLAKDIARISWEIWFKVNQEQIIAEKCENKAIPMMHCNGKCYLSKQLKKLEEKESEHNSKTNPFSHLLKIDLISELKAEIQLVYLLLQESIDYSACREGQTSGYSNFVFHPPA